MRKRTLALLMALALALGAAPTALAAAEPALICEFLRDNETAFLTLEDLERDPLPELEQVIGLARAYRRMGPSGQTG